MMTHLWLMLNFIPPYQTHEWDICRRNFNGATNKRRTRRRFPAATWLKADKVASL
jgi:hypothetical protein